MQTPDFAKVGSRDGGRDLSDPGNAFTAGVRPPHGVKRIEQPVKLRNIVAREGSN